VAGVRPGGGGLGADLSGREATVADDWRFGGSAPGLFGLFAVAEDRVGRPIPTIAADACALVRTFCGRETADLAPVVAPAPWA
jgi:hypothetical protein